MKLITLFIFQALLIGTPCLAKKPNILFISVDDLNDWAGYRGHSQVISPHMDRLAKKSTWFSRAYCQYPLCGPSRASVMSGLYYHQLESKKLQAEDKYVEDKVQSMGSELLHGYFKKHGYKTMAVGKVLHKHLPKKNLHMSGGRGKWNHNRDEDGKQVETNWKSNKTLTDWAPCAGKESEMSDSLAADWAVERLQKKHTKPFMLMVGFLRPHVPWHVPQKYFDMYDREKITTPPYQTDDLNDVPQAAKDTINDGYPRTEWAVKENQWKHIVQSYLASITFVDTKVGQVLDALEASPYRDNTIVVLWSDHGYHLGEKNTFQKHTLWDRSASAPLIISLPPSMQGEKHRGKTDAVVGLIDIYPTLVDLCGLPANDKVVGRSLKPLLLDREAAWNHPALTYMKDGARSLRTDRYRYIEYGDGSKELYDHKVDPNEWNNLAPDAEHASVLKELEQKMSQHHIE
ncbi:sulfatase [Akkermansiaceae bacterium]|nr:sulfatase [Akkermansiaceae bacterium]MDB4412762.1 sulfatase [bacterium]